MQPSLQATVMCEFRASRPIPISPSTSAEFGPSATIHDGNVPTVSAASLHARASDAALRDYLMWRRVGSPLVSDDGDVPTVTAASLQARASDAALRDYLCGNQIAIATRRLDGVEAQNQTD